MTATVANLAIATAYARRGWPVFPTCHPSDGACGCGGGHEGRDIGKAPIGRLAPHGVKDATTNTATIDRWWRSAPCAGVGVALEPAHLLLIDPDSAETEAAAISRGLDGGIPRESRNRAYIFTRPDGCPTINLIKLDGAPIDIMATGYVVAHGTHASGCPVRLDPTMTPGPAPAWAVELLRQKADARAASEAATAARRAERSAHGGAGPEPPVRLHQRGLRRWTGELVAMSTSEKLDRDLSLFYLGLDLAECGASEPTIVAALAERDATLGWQKFTGRTDAEKRYGEIADKAVARAIELEQTPRVTPAAPPAADASLGELRAALEDAQAEVTRLRRRALDQDDRLEVLEDIVHSIDDVLGRPNEELSAGEKVALIATARWLPSYRARQAANDKPATIALGYVAKVSGTSRSTLSGMFARFSSDDPEDGAPFRKRVTRKLKVDENGSPVFDPRTGRQQYESELELAPWGKLPSETLRAAVRFAAAHPRPQHGGSAAASDARWGRCDKHQNREVRVKGYCPDCGKVVGERVMHLAEFDALNVQLAHSDAGDSPHGVDRYLIGREIGDSDSANRPDGLNVQVVDSGPPDPPDWLDEWRGRPSAFETGATDDGHRAGGGHPRDRDAKAGEMLAEMPKHQGGYSEGALERLTPPPTLDDLGGPLGPAAGGTDEIHGPPLGGRPAGSAGARAPGEPARLDGRPDAAVAGDPGGAGAGVDGPPGAAQLTEAAWPEDGAWLRLAPLDMPDELVCKPHGLPFLKGKRRCSLCEHPPEPPIPPAPKSEKCMRIGCRRPCGPGDPLLCPEHRAEVQHTAIAGGES